MNYTGKAPATYKYYINKELQASGSMEEIAEEIGVTRHAIWNRCQKTRKRIREGGKPRIHHELEVDKPSIHEYAMIVRGKLVGCGTIKELSELTNYAYDYLLKISNGNFDSKSIKMYKKVKANKIN